ncbi:MAG TPA: DUF3800 domain-containing protein [Streptosporangiales bacterium]
MSRKGGRGSHPVAFVDESATGHAAEGGPKYYTMTAVIVNPREIERVRERLRTETGGELHANNTQPHERAALTAVLADEPGVRSVVTVRSGFEGKEYETARRDCLAELTRRVSRQDVRLMMMDDRSGGSGSDKLNRLDRETVAAARPAGRQVEIQHVRDEAEPLVQAADVVGWQVRRGIERGDPSYLAPVVGRQPDKMQIHEAPRFEPGERRQQQAAPAAPATGAGRPTGLQARVDRLVREARGNAPTPEQALAEARKSLREAQQKAKASAGRGGNRKAGRQQGAKGREAKQRGRNRGRDGRGGR